MLGHVTKQFKSYVFSSYFNQTINPSSPKKQLFFFFSIFSTLSIASSNQAETVFAIIFVVVWIGAGVVTLNAKLLGGRM